MTYGITYTCPKCQLNCSSESSLSRHCRSKHRQFTPAPEDEDDNSFQSCFHPLLNALPCDAAGKYLTPFTAPAPRPAPQAHGQNPAAWAPFESCLQFNFAHYHFAELQTSERKINKALDMWAATALPFKGTAPWANVAELYAAIDKIQQGDMPWRTYKIPGFKGLVDMIPYEQFNHSSHRVWSNLMSGDWAWKQADLIAVDADNHGRAFIPIIAGSDKTMVSVATGHQEYHLVYASPRILTCPARRAHRNGVLPIAFLVIPKTSKKHRTKPIYQKFCCQMYHTSLTLMYQPLKPFMDSPDIVCCPDGHWCHMIYGIGPYIADYPEQVWLTAVVQDWCPKCDARPDHLNAEGACLRTRTKTETLITCFDPGILWDDYGVRANIVPFTNKFLQADIHEILSSDLLHQVIKGTFKGHIVSWVNEYLHLEHGEKQALEIIQDIDRRISAVPEFPGLCRFPDGRDFSQWMGNDLKALMKIYLGAIAGYLPWDMIKAISAFMEFCYLVHCNAISAPDLMRIQDALNCFHHYRQIFIECGVCVDISLPCQHSLIHYIHSIQFFGLPNGLCSSITESKHIKAVKEPWQHSSHFNVLSQMLVSLARLDKIAALKAVLTVRSMLTGTMSSYTAQVLAGKQPQVDAAAALAAVADDENNNNGTVHGPRSLSDIELAPTPQCGYPKSLEVLAAHIQQPQFTELFQRSTGGMYREQIQSDPNWHGYARHDMVLVDVGSPVMGGIVIGRVLLFFSFVFSDRRFECALVNWLIPVGDTPDPDMGMWVVELEHQHGVPTLAIIPLDSVAHASHLIGVYGTAALPEDFHFSDSLDVFNTYFVNPYADHHMHEFLM
ncbi:hypothetical protein C8R44DRAFT_828463 [Mycena epipterygia]|nr:hypothetical protein C8R44DRAFT_828463 [Mycena epipterygia]